MIVYSLLASAGYSSPGPWLSIDPSRETIPIDFRNILGACFKQPTSLELDLRNYPSNLNQSGLIKWRQAGSPITAWTSNEDRHEQNVLSAIANMNQIVQSVTPRDSSIPWSPLVFDSQSGTIHHQSQTGFLHTCRKVNKTAQAETVSLASWIHDCVEDAKLQGETVWVDQRSFNAGASVPANSSLTLFEALNSGNMPWRFLCSHYEAVEDEPAHDVCYLGRTPTYFTESQGRLRALESYGRLGATGCDGLP